MAATIGVDDVLTIYRKMTNSQVLSHEMNYQQLKVDRASYKERIACLESEAGMLRRQIEELRAGIGVVVATLRVLDCIKDAE